MCVKTFGAYLCNYCTFRTKCYYILDLFHLGSFFTLRNFRPSTDMPTHTYKKKTTCEEHEKMIHALYCRFGDRGTDFAHVLLGLEVVPTRIPSISISF